MTRLVTTSLALLALVAAGCGSSGGGSGASGTVAVRSTSLGKILVDSSGRTLYLFEKDTKGRSACSGSCAGNWPPVTVTAKPTAGAGVKASLLGTTTRSDGMKEVTYAGHPLYRYAGDSAAGDTNGEAVNAFGAAWYVLDVSGATVKQGGRGTYGYGM